MNETSVLLIGDHQHVDFQEAVCWLSDHTRLTQVSTFDEGLECLGRVGRQDTALIAQSRPGQFSARLVEALHAASPLSRIVGLMGSWCEGEMRTGRPWPGVIRILWHQWKPRLIPHLQPNCDARLDTWSLPRTASLAEQMAVTTQVEWPPRQGLISIHTQTYRDYGVLSDTCSHAGYSTVWCSTVRPLHARGVEAAVFDGIAADSPTLARLSNIAQEVHPAPVVALLDYVRRQDFDQSLAAGAAEVLAKPLLTYDLLWHLDNLIGAQQEPSVEARVPSSVTPAA